MQLRTLGRSGLLVSEHCLGTMTFGAETLETDAHAILDAFVAAGGTFIDTADVYAAGKSERIVGRWLAARGGADDLVIATKGRFPVGPDARPNDQGLSRAHLTRALDASLTRLGVDHVDLYQVHAWDPLTPAEEWMVTLDGFVRAGKVRHVGVSNLTGWQLQRAAMIARSEGLAPVVTLQPQYNLLARDIELELTDLCALEGIGLLPWSPLGGGWLTGKYRADAAPTGATRLGEDPERGVEAYAKRNVPRTYAILAEVERIAADHGATMAQVALAWVGAQPNVDSTILGVRTLAQLEDDVGALEVDLSVEELAALDGVSAPEIPDYPYGMIRRVGDPRLAALDG